MTCNCVCILESANIMTGSVSELYSSQLLLNILKNQVFNMLVKIKHNIIFVAG